LRRISARGHADLTIVAVAFQIVRGDGDADGVEAAAPERAGFSEGHEIGTVIATHLQHHGGLSAFALPIPVLGVDQPPRPARLRQHDDAGAAIRLVRCFQPRPDLWLGELQYLGACIEQRDILEGNAGALGDAAHLLDIGRLESFDDRQIVAHQLGHAAGVERKLPELGEIVRGAFADAIGGQPPILPTTLTRRPGDFDQGKRFDHLCHQVPFAIRTSLMYFVMT
jgi:hypothetical protein